MKTLVSGLSVLALVAGIAVGCSDSGTGRVGENPSERRTPSASPPTTMPDTPSRTPGSGTTDTTPTPVPPPATAPSPSDRAPSR